MSSKPQVLIVQKPNSQYSLWSPTDEYMSFLYFIKYNNPYCHKGLHPPHLLLHFYVHFIIKQFLKALNVPKT